MVDMGQLKHVLDTDKGTDEYWCSKGPPGTLDRKSFFGGYSNIQNTTISLIQAWWKQMNVENQLCSTCEAGGY